MGRPLRASDRLIELAAEQTALLTKLSEARDVEAEAVLQDGGLIADITSDDLDDSGRLGKLIEQRLPEVDLPGLLIEVDRWTDFTDQLTPLSGSCSRSPEMPCILYAAIIAQATNLGLSDMTRASDFGYQQLEWASEQYLRDDTLTAASACLVDRHHRLPLIQAWGTGRLSSSDGKRFASRTRGPGVAALPRYFGHRRRGLQIYLMDLGSVPPVREQGRRRDRPRCDAHPGRDPR